MNSFELNEWDEVMAMTIEDWKRMQSVLMNFPDAMAALNKAYLKVRLIEISKNDIEDVEFSTDCPYDRYGQHKMAQRPVGGEYCCACGYRKE